MEDRNLIQSTMDGQPYEAGYHAATLRRFLWREHLGLLPAQSLDSKDDPNAQPPNDCPNDIREGKEYDFVADPMSDELWDMWTGNATKNTETYRVLFRADPDDHSKTIPLLCLNFPETNLDYFPVQEWRHVCCVFANFVDTVRTFKDYQEFLPKTGVKQGHLYDPFMPGEEVREKLQQIKGHLVWMPLHFLEEENMAERGMQVNSITESVYT